MADMHLQMFGCSRIEPKAASCWAAIFSLHGLMESLMGCSEPMMEPVGSSCVPVITFTATFWSLQIPADGNKIVLE